MNLWIVYLWQMLRLSNKERKPPSANILLEKNNLKWKGTFRVNKLNKMPRSPLGTIHKNVFTNY